MSDEGIAVQSKPSDKPKDGAAQPAPSKPAESDGNTEGLVMHVKVQSPQKVFFDEAAASVSAENDTGPFDILPKHHNFITLLNSCELCVRRPGRLPEQKIKISGGLMHVKEDDVIVFLDV